MLGTLSALWRYPVKSLRGEPREWLDLNARGVMGDRLFALRNADGRFASGKAMPGFFRQEGLLALQAACEGSIPLITLADGRAVRGDQPDIHAALSAALGQPLTLVHETETLFMDAAAVHLLTTASLAWLRNVLPEARVDERRFRPNLLIDCPGAAPVEQGWLGKTLRIGKEVVLRVTSPTERCAMVVHAQSDLPQDATVLKCIAQQADLNFGVYAEVLASGRITRGDDVSVES